MKKEYKSFKEFYPYYLSEHMNPICRGLHVFGTFGVFIVIIFSFFNIKYIIVAPFIGYGFAWMGHYFFENNSPATFRYPMYSFFGDWLMFIDILKGKESILHPKDPFK